MAPWRSLATSNPVAEDHQAEVAEEQILAAHLGTGIADRAVSADSCCTDCLVEERSIADEPAARSDRTCLVCIRRAVAAASNSKVDNHMIRWRVSGRSWADREETACRIVRWIQAAGKLAEPEVTEHHCSRHGKTLLTATAKVYASEEVPAKV